MAGSNTFKVFDAHALYSALDAKRRALNIRWYVVAFECGVTPSALTRLGYGHTISTDSFLLLLAWLGEDSVKPYVRAF